VLVNLMFWLIWVNLLLGFTNLIPMVPFDGGHMFRDVAHGSLEQVRRAGKKTRLFSISGHRTEALAMRATSMTSLSLFLMLVLMILIPYLR